MAFSPEELWPVDDGGGTEDELEELAGAEVVPLDEVDDEDGEELEDDEDEELVEEEDSVVELPAMVEAEDPPVMQDVSVPAWMVTGDE